jgi:hypothetical protein
MDTAESSHSQMLFEEGCHNCPEAGLEDSCFEKLWVMLGTDLGVGDYEIFTKVAVWMIIAEQREFGCGFAPRLRVEALCGLPS